MLFLFLRIVPYKIAYLHDFLPFLFQVRIHKFSFDCFLAVFQGNE